MGTPSKFWRPFGRPRRACAPPPKRLALEPLEDRKLLALLGIAGQLEFPVVTYNSTGVLTYNVATQELDLDASPLLFRQSAVSPIRPVVGNNVDVQIHVRVDHAGALAGGAAGDDLVVLGDIDADGNGSVDFSGTLLRGEVTGFGFSETGATDRFDFRFTPTGGALAGLWAGKDIGVTTTSENSGFAGGFDGSFEGGAKGNIGAVSALLSSLAGHVYHDANNNGLFETALGEAGIPAATVTLTGTDNLGNPVDVSTTTDAAGAYLFDGLRPGDYVLTETQPAGFLDGKDTIGTPGGSTSNDRFFEIALPAGFDGVNNDFGEILPARLAGCVYLDTDNDGVEDADENGILGVQVRLTGTDDLAGAVDVTTVTNAAGQFSFEGLRPGTYRLNEVHPVVFLDGIDTLGNLGGTASNDQFAAIVLAGGDSAVDYCFGERGLEPTLITKEQLLASTPPILARWVESLYQNVLGRSGSLGEILGWLNAIDAGATFDQVANAFLWCHERRSGIIGDLYQQFLARGADAQGLAHWLRVWDAAGLEAVQSQIVGSAEFYQSAGGTDASWIGAVYQEFLGRSAAAGETAFWTARLAASSREAVVMAIVTSREYRQAQIADWYTSYLGRTVDGNGLEHWLSRLGSGATQEAIQSTLLASLESRLRWK